MDGDELSKRLSSHAEHIRSSGAIGRSPQINRLFDFLIIRSLSGSIPKEIEIAHEVFGLSLNANVAVDATVRANIHRLRKKLEEAPPSPEGDRLVLPRGEYRLMLVREDVPPNVVVTALPPPAGGTTSGNPYNEQRWKWIASIAMMLAIVFGGLFLLARRPEDPRLQSGIWRPFVETRFPTLLVSGDTYMFGELDGHGNVARLISDPSITSREALDHAKMLGVEGADRFVDMDYHYLPEAMASALASIVPIVRAVGGSEEAFNTASASRFTTDMLSKNHVVYVGLFRGLGVLRDPLFEGSGFSLSEDGDAITDTVTGHRFQSDWADPSEARLLRHDYAYVASRRGLSGNRLLIVAGTRDPALTEAAKIVSSAARLKELTRAAGVASFEALYEVRTFGPSSYASRLLILRRLGADAVLKGNVR